MELSRHWHIYSHLRGSGGAPADCVMATLDKVTVVCEGVVVGGEAACVGCGFVGAHRGLEEKLICRLLLFTAPAGPLVTLVFVGFASRCGLWVVLLVAGEWLSAIEVR